MANEQSSLKRRLQALEPALNKICEVAGTPGISVGVVHDGYVVHEFSHGFSDLEAKVLFGKNTLVPMGTMAKTFTASAVGILVAQGRLKWTTPIKEILPEFRSSDPVVEAELNVTDLLCHRSGLARSNMWWQGAQSVLLLEKKDLLPFYARLPRAGSFRGDWAYSNWGYALVGAVIEKVSGSTYGEFLEREIVKPLGLERTTFQPLDSSVQDLAKPYAALDDASPYLLPQPPVNDTTIMAPAMGGATTASDLLKYSIALLKAQKQELLPAAASEGEIVLKGALKQLSGHIYTSPHTLEKSYALGWYRSQLPSNVLGMGWNSIYVKKMPQLIPRGHSGPIVAHGGSLPGYHTAVALLPALQSGVVVLTNSISLGDVSGWVSLAIAEALIDAPEPSDFVALATEAAGNNAVNVSKLQAQLEKSRPQGSSSPPAPLEQYAGTYRDAVHGWQVDIRQKGEEELEVAFRGLDSQQWSLSYYGKEAQGETFLWLASREGQAKRCRMTTYPLVANHFKLIFKSEPSGAVSGLYWPHEAGVPVEQQFFAKL